MRKSALNPANTRPASQRSETVHWDTEVPKLGLRQRGTNSSWIVQWRADGRTRKQTLGRSDAIPLPQARELARTLLDGVAKGAAPDAAPTVAAFSRRYLKDLAPSWKPATHRAHAHDVEHLIIPYLGSKRLNQVTRADLVSWKDGLPGSAASGNRALAVFSGMMRHAELLGLQPPGSNPCKGLRRRKTSFKATYLSEAQWARLGTALRRLEETHPREAGFFRFLALTGCRKGEALALRWDMIDGPRCALPDAKSGPRAIWLGRPAKRVLASFPRSNLYVFGEGKDPMPDHRIDRIWRKLRQSAKLDGIRLHDLRHSFASVGVNAGLDLRVIGGLLGHSDLATTEGYAHLEDRTIKAASQRVGTHLEKIVKAPASGLGAGRSLYQRFCRSSLSIDAFCAENGIDPATFRNGLVAWRRTSQNRGAGA
ncbi:site-specific integrase [Leisingera daeponensis]|uniref:site-specific integrase n=1 Tax=Leisingera daeponensis TaxID=405746 RepID=UPI001C95CDB2|nr:site-specific integrase [Leisingera daeponensis]MBY6059515.1 tyrosine-type recombinase/integrase [Leisingera daeponensis]